MSDSYPTKDDIQELKVMIKELQATVNVYNERMIIVEQKIAKRPTQACIEAFWIIAEKAVERNNDTIFSRHSDIHKKWDKEKTENTSKNLNIANSALNIISKIFPILVLIYMVITR